MESFLITLLVIAIAGLSNWLQHRAQSQHQPPPNTGPKPPPAPSHHPTAPPPARPRTTLESTLERELRRLLGEEIPEPAHPRPAPPQVPTPHLHVPAQPQPHAPPRPMPPLVAPAPVAPSSVAGRFHESSVAFNRAQQLHQSVGERLRQIDSQTDKHGPKRARPVAPPTSAPLSPIYALGRNTQAARQAFIASLVFGVPKSLED